MKITIGGPPGSGTTTIAALLSDKLKLKHIYAGKIFREMAAEKGLTLQEFSNEAEKYESFDKSVDRELSELADENTIIEGRMAAFVVKDPDLKIWLDAPLNVRVSRIAKRENLDEKEVREMTIQRQQSEIQRYNKYYGVNIYDLSHYDIVVNTLNWDIDGVFAILETAITNLVRATQE